MRKSIISFDEKMSWWKGDFFVDDTIALAMTKAYHDLMRTIRGFSANPKHDQIINSARQTLHAAITNMLLQKYILKRNLMNGIKQRAMT